jgi:GNAT superfamily N-acetyltransferase
MTSYDVEVAKPGDADGFWREHDRAARSELWKFRVIWHEQQHDVVAHIAGDEGRHFGPVGAVHARVAASLAHVESLYVLEGHRRQGIGRALLGRIEELANYYNCHKVSVAVKNQSDAQRFLEACGYHVEAVIPQHTFKLDVAMLRKFLL